MRARDVPPGPAPASGRPLRRSVLLTTEVGASSASADVTADLRTLIRGLPEIEFVLWTLSPEPAAAGLHSIVGHIVEQPTWNAPPGASFGTRPPHRRRPSASDVERGFVPALRAFLEATIDANGPGELLAATLLDLRDYLLRFNAARTWRSPLAWEVVRDHVLVRARGASVDDGDPWAGREGSWSRNELPTIGEAAQALAWLARMLGPLTIEVPNVDLVHATTAGFSAIPGVMARVERGTPLLLTENGVAPRDFYLELQRLAAPFHLKRFAADIAGAVARTVYRLADRIAPASRHTMRWQLAYGAPRARMEVVHPGVDNEVYRPMEVPRPRRRTVVQVSPIEPGKDQMTLLHVADLVRREVPRVVFLQFGEVTDQPYWEVIQATRHRLGLEGAVRFVGPAADPPRALALGDVALLTSRSEAFPRSVLEALMCGLPVVSTDVGGIREALNGAGIVAPVGDAAALAEAVAAELRISPEQRERVRQAARDQAVARFGLGRFLDDHRRLYDEITSRPSPVGAPATAMEAVVRIPDAAGDHVDAVEPVAEPESTPPAPGWPGADVASVVLGTSDPEDRDEPVRPLAPEGIEIVVPGPGPDDRLQIVEQPDPAEIETTRHDAPIGVEPIPLEPSSDEQRAHEREAEPERAPVAVAAEPVAAQGEPIAGTAGRDVEPVLRIQLSHPDPAVRAEALRGLQDPGSADFAVAALSDGDTDVRREAARALGRLNGPRAGRWLSNAVSADPSPKVRGEAVAALAALLSRSSGRGT